MDLGNSFSGMGVCCALRFDALWVEGSCKTALLVTVLFDPGESSLLSLSLNTRCSH